MFKYLKDQLSALGQKHDGTQFDRNDQRIFVQAGEVVFQASFFPCFHRRVDEIRPSREQDAAASFAGLNVQNNSGMGFTGTMPANQRQVFVAGNIIAIDIFPESQ